MSASPARDFRKSRSYRLNSFLTWASMDHSAVVLDLKFLSADAVKNSRKFKSVMLAHCQSST
ncbi:hypothetical protein MES5069_460101 [Mesorhizobium escarrei]|uniref:Uncharacterized protein n=1 Tax=Mesorhizobium escarrei TaxID=666018 RepID=A0ABN8K530_9HYPH|nr:hypothetical protein MES5069_460101 [Mesorhizobium escarrei]